MRYLLTLFYASITVFQAAAQNNSVCVPPEVRKAFTAQYPHAHLKNWRQKEQVYVATFRQDGRKCLASYTTGGSWKTTESPVKWSRNLPAPVRAAWNNCKYRDWLILDMKKLDQPAQILYSIHVGQVQSLGPDDSDIGSEYSLFFSDSGQLVKVERRLP